jgi:hypothetical protein
MDSKRRPTERELEELRSKVIESEGAITDDGRWMREAQNHQGQPVVVDAVSTNPKPRKEKVWNTWDNWEEMRAH